MIRGTYFILVAVLVLVSAPRVEARQIVVLTEEPVAEFTLPDGTVLKNAYVWRRTSEGLMIIHDDGQFFLNYKMLPNDWRRAYQIDESVEQVPMAITKRYDQYALYHILERIEMPRTTITFLESDRYQGQADAHLLLACSLQALLDRNLTAANRLNTAVSNYFPEVTSLDLGSFYLGCEPCSSNGVFVVACRKCRSNGECIKCGGEGKIKTQLGQLEDDDSGKSKRRSNRKSDSEKEDNFSAGSSEFDDTDAVRCVDCKGSGKCMACRGTGKRSSPCRECKGDGATLNAAGVKEELAVQITVLNNVKNGIPPPKPVEKTEQEDSSGATEENL